MESLSQAADIQSPARGMAASTRAGPVESSDRDKLASWRGQEPPLARPRRSSALRAAGREDVEWQAQSLGAAMAFSSQSPDFPLRIAGA